MKKIFEVLENKPRLFEASPQNIWNTPYISKNMLNAHLDENLDSATRKLSFVEKSVNWICEITPPNKYPALLDLGCGPGIYAELFCKKGYNVTGIDLSKLSITYARNSARMKHLKINYIQGDYTKLNINNKYHLITMIFCDFGVLSNEARTKLTVDVYNSLLPGGIFLFDVFTPLKYAKEKERKDWEICEDGFWHQDLYLLLHAFYRYEEDNTFLNQYIVATKNEFSYYNVWEHTFTLNELNDNLKSIGFRNIHFFSSVAVDSYNDNCDTICVLAKK